MPFSRATKSSASIIERILSASVLSLEMDAKSHETQSTLLASETYRVDVKTRSSSKYTLANEKNRMASKRLQKRTWSVMYDP
jgi:hypothetical protein